MTPEARAELVRLKELLRKEQETPFVPTPPQVEGSDEPVKPKRGRKAKE